MIFAPESSAIGLSLLECGDCQVSTYCQPWPNGRRQDVQLEFGKTGYDFLSGEAIEPLYTGETTTVGSSQIIDSGANFTSPPIAGGMLVANINTAQTSKVDSVASATAVNIEDDIFGSGTLGNTYVISRVRSISGNTTYTFAGGEYAVNISPSILGSLLVLEDVFPNTTNRFWVEIDFENYVSGNPVVKTGNYPGVTTQLDGAAPSVTGNGTYKFIGIPTGADLVIEDLSEDCLYSITGIRIYYIERPQILIYEGSVLEDTIDPVLYLHDRANFQLPWDYGNGCYGVYVDNFNGLIGRSNFPNAEGWTFDNVSNGWGFDGNTLVHVPDVGVGTNTATYELGFTTDPNCNYVIYLNIQAPDEPPLEVPTIELITASGDIVVSTYIDSSGNSYINVWGYEFSAIRFSMPLDESVTINFFNIYNTYYQQIGGYFYPDTNEELTEFRIAPNYCTPNAGVCVQETVCEYKLFESTIENTDFTPRMLNNRMVDAQASWSEVMFLAASVRHGRYDGEGFEGYRDISGRGGIVFSQRKKVVEVQLRAVPQWVHDWVTWAYLNIFEIEEIEYVPVDGSYSPNWSRSSADAPAVFEVYKQDQKTIKTGC